jgi:hypothetical protein
MIVMLIRVRVMGLLRTRRFRFSYGVHPVESVTLTKECSQPKSIILMHVNTAEWYGVQQLSQLLVCNFFQDSSHEQTHGSA